MKIKQQYLEKLSEELFKRGAKQEQEKEIVIEMEETLDKYLQDNFFKSLKKFEEKFGDVGYICDEYGMFIEGKMKRVNWRFWIEIIIAAISILIIPLLGFVLIIYDPYWGLGLGNPYLGTSIVYFFQTLKIILFFSKGYGVIGSITGMLAYTWILQKFFLNRYSNFDRRRKISIFILLAYWFIVTIWIIYATLILSFLIESIPYNDFYSVKLFIANFTEIAYRWILLGVVVISAAIFYTIDFKRLRGHSSKKKKMKLSENISLVSTFFIIACFIVPNPIMSITMMVIGLISFITNQANGKVWFLGLCALIVQFMTLWEFSTLTEAVSGWSSWRLFYGFKIDYMEIALNNKWVLYLIFSILVILWTSISFALIRIKKQRFFPRFSVPKIKKQWKSFLLLSLVLLAVLGSRPHESFYDSGTELYYSNVSNIEIYELVSTYEIPSSGTIYLVVFSNDSVVNDWYFTWRPTVGEIVILNVSDFESVAFADNRTNYNYALKVVGSGILEFWWDLSAAIEEYNHDWNELFREARIGADANWNAQIPWFPTLTEIIILIVTILNLFLSWDKTTISKKDMKEFIEKESN